MALKKVVAGCVLVISLTLHTTSHAQELSIGSCPRFPTVKNFQIDKVNFRINTAYSTENLRVSFFSNMKYIFAVFRPVVRVLKLLCNISTFQ